MHMEELQELLWGFASHRVITVAGCTGILTHLALRTDAPERVAAALELDPLATGKIVRALAALGLLEAVDGGYRVVPTLAPRFAPGPEALTAFLAHSHSMYERWGENLESWLRGDAWATQRRSGGPDAAAFGAAMQAIGADIARRVAATLDLEGVRRLLDVGGGFGHYARALCTVRPEMHATVLDKPEVTALAEQALDGTAWAGRIAFVGGDYLESDYGAGFDLVLFANVLHQETAARAAAMVRRGAAALAPGGRVAVVDFAIDDAQHAHVLGALFAINMRSFGDTHPEPAIRGWLADAGLGQIARTDINRHRWLIVGRRAA
jgi:SAM-dependent methyltransferase